MIKHILVPVDFSDTSENAVHQAAVIAKKATAEITLLHAYLIPGYSGGMAYETFIPPVDEHIDLINKQLDDFASQFDELAAIKVNKVTIPGSVRDMISQFVDDNAIDLVVSGTRGASGFFGYLLGTQSERIEGEVSCPVLILPAEKDLSNNIRVALAHDYKSMLTSVQRDMVGEFLQLYNATLTVAHVEDKNDSPEAELSIRENLKVLNPTFHKVVNSDVEKGLNDFIEQQDIGALVIIYHDHGFLNRIFGNSTSRKLTHHAKIPILVLK